MIKLMPHLFAAFTRVRYQLEHLKIKFVSTCRHIIISSIFIKYKVPENTKLINTVTTNVVSCMKLENSKLNIKNK